MVCLFGAIQSTIMAACVERDKEQWRLGLNIRLYSSAYAVSGTIFSRLESSSIQSFTTSRIQHVICFTQGLVASGFAFPLLSWCLRKKGPLFIAVFSPLMLIFVAVLSSILLNEALYLGRWIHFGPVLHINGCASADYFFPRLNYYVSHHCSVLGSILIVGGLYLVLWGKAKEQAEVSKDDEMGRESIPMTPTSEMK
jgi:drug/metabolite transporter (DMT)-like permease